MEFGCFKDKRICVAVSGGVDSVSLLHALYRASKTDGFILSAVHCEHGIRGKESVDDGAFVKKLCEDLGIECFYFSEDCIVKAEREKTSLETAARNFRYGCFAALIKENKADFIATAHHKNDEAETVLFRIARGTALSGAKGMTETSGWLLRPFLDKTRAEIERYAQQNGLAFREDKTNFEEEATRNKLRLSVLPLLENAVPGAVENISRFARLAAEDDALLYEYASGLVTDSSLGGKKEYRVAFCDKKPLFSRACLIVLKKLGVEKDYTALHLENAYSLQKLCRGAKCTFPKNIEAEKTENGVVFYVKTDKKELPLSEEKPFDDTGFDGGRYEVKLSSEPFDEEDGLRILRIDKDKLPVGCVFRFRKEGDFIRSFGGKKTLKKFFNEKKTAVKERKGLPLIAQKDGAETYVVCGVEISESVKVDEETQSVLYIKTRKIKE